MQDIPSPSQLREGYKQTINGRVWTLVNGQPVDITDAQPRQRQTLQGMVQNVFQQPSVPTRAKTFDEIATESAPALAAAIAAPAAGALLGATGLPVGVAAGTGWLTRTAVPLLTESLAAGTAAYGAGRATGMSPEQAQQAGLVEGGMQAAFGGMGKALSAAGERLYRSTLLQGDKSRREFGDVAGEMFKKGRPVTQSTFNKIESSIDDLVKQQDDILRTIEQQSDPRWVDVNFMTGDRSQLAPQIEAEFKDYVSSLEKVDPDAATKAAERFAERMRSFVKRKEFLPTVNAQGLVDEGLTVSEVLNTKREFQKKAQNAYARLKANPGSTLTYDEMFDVGMASYLKKQLEQFPEVAQINKQIQPLIGEARVLESALNRLSKHTPLGGPSDWTTLGILAAAETPSFGTAAASKLATYAPTRWIPALGAKYAGKALGSAPTAVRLGEVVTIMGEPVVVTKVNDDGTYEGRPARKP